MKNNSKKGCRPQGDWQLEVRLIDLHIRQRQAVIREHQQVISQLRALRQEILVRHKRRRRCLWDDGTPMIRLVNLHQLERFKTLLDNWKKHATDTIDTSKTSNFTFLPNRKWHAVRALAIALQGDVPLFKVSTRELCRYLSVHSNLGTQEGIKKAIQRAMHGR
ncbi:MAG: hypothetical protein IJQ13_02290 [Prevotella sp.]|nr:hypothetical protein [Prevotella sp.]